MDSHKFLSRYKGRCQMYDNLKTYIAKFDRRLWILALGWIASAFGFSISIPFIGLYFHSELGMSLIEIGVFFGVTAIIRASAQALAGEISDHLGRYSLMVMAQLIRTVIFFITAYAIYYESGFLIVGSLLILNAIFGAIFQPVAQATVADLVEFKDRTDAYAMIRSAGNFGWALGPGIGGFVAGSSYSVLFVISGCMTLISSMIIAKYLKGIKARGNNDKPFKLKDMFVYKGNELILKFVIFVFVIYLVFAQLISPFSIYSVDLMGISKVQLGMLFTLNGLMVSLFQLPVTRLLRKYKLTSQLALGSIIFAGGYLVVGFSTTFVFFIVAMVVITAGENCVSPPALALTANLAPEGRTGRYMGIYGFAVTIGWSLGPLIGLSLLDWFKPNYVYSWAIISFLALISAIGFKTISKIIPDNLNRPNR